MDNVCFSLIIRDRICQSGVPVTSEKVYTNISGSEVIVLQYGYTLTVSNAPSNVIKLSFVNVPLGVSFSGSITDDSYAIYDLPIDSGTYRVGVFSSKHCCCIGG